jgi:hypothetical protein
MKKNQESLKYWKDQFADSISHLPQGFGHIKCTEYILNSCNSSWMLTKSNGIGTALMLSLFFLPTLGNTHTRKYCGYVK